MVNFPDKDSSFVGIGVLRERRLSLASLRDDKAS